MNTNEKYLEQAEIKVKNLLSDLYESESVTLKEIGKTKEKYTERITHLEAHYSEVLKQREELQKKFSELKSADSSGWEKAKENFELMLNYLEGDRESFIQQAESVLLEISEKIDEVQKKTVDAAAEAKQDLNEKIDEMKHSKEELQEKLDKIKSDTSDKWKEVKHWFAEKSKSARDYITSVVHD